jgi:hypothetical protein
MPSPRSASAFRPAGPAHSAIASQPIRFYGSVEIDMARPMRAFDHMYNSVVQEL